MAKRAKANGIYLLEVSDVSGARVRDIRRAEFFVERSPGIYEDAGESLGRREPCIPTGPQRYPFEQGLLKSYGAGSGFAPETPRLKAEFYVKGFDDDRPLRDLIWSGTYFRMGTWIISERFKAFLNEIDRGGWDYWPISTSIHTKTKTKAGPDVWLCDLVRGMRAMDDAPSSKNITARMAQRELRFQLDDETPFFRDALLWNVLCPESTHGKVVEAGITGLTSGLVGERYG